MTGTNWRQTHREERDVLLQKATQMLEADSRIRAAWLFGSLGRGEADDLSDLDLWIVVAEEHIAEFVAGRREQVAKIGKPMLILEGPQNAPSRGAYLLVLYPGNAGPQQVDWYWQPESDAKLPENARLLFDRMGVARSGLPPLVASPGPQTPDERAAAASDRALFFWAMIPIAAKYVARRKSWAALGMISMLRNTLNEAKRYTEISEPEASTEPALPASSTEQMAMLRDLARQMQSLHPQIVSLGGQVPDEAVPEILTFFGFITTDLQPV